MVRHSLCLLTLLLLAFGTTPVAAQKLKIKNQSRMSLGQNARPTLYPGVAGGIGGGQLWAGFTADLHYGNRWTLRLHPGLWYGGAGIQYQFGPVRWSTDCSHRPMFLSFWVLDDWLLSGGGDAPADRDLYLLMLGMHRKLTPRGDVYLEIAGGIAFGKAKYEPAGASPYSNQLFFPIAEVRIGGIFTRMNLLDRKRK